MQSIVMANMREKLFLHIVFCAGLYYTQVFVHSSVLPFHLTIHAVFGVVGCVTANKNKHFTPTQTLPSVFMLRKPITS